MKKSIGEVLEKIERERASRIQKILESNSNRISQSMVVKSGGGIPCKGIWFTQIYKFLGGIAISYIDIDIIGNPPDIVKIFTVGYSGVKTNRSRYTDKCRSFQLLYTEDFIEYKALPTIYQESRYLNSEIVTTGLFPPEAIGFGVRWLRGGEQFDRTF